MEHVSCEKINFRNTLLEEIKKINISVDDEVLEKLEKYKELLVEWNEKINLTAITDNYGIIMKHFIDCLEIVKYINEGSSVIDVGTGAGFPGIIISIFFKGKVKVTLLDALNKRLIFLQEVIDKLGLKNVTIIHGRAEEVAQDIKYRQKYDIAVSRAVAGLNVLLEYDIPFVSKNGKCLLMKGDNVEKEIKESSNALNILKCKINDIYKYSYKVDTEMYNRSILEIKKADNTPLKYPRNNSQIKKKPL